MEGYTHQGQGQLGSEVTLEEVSDAEVAVEPIGRRLRVGSEERALVLSPKHPTIVRSVLWCDGRGVSDQPL